MIAESIRINKLYQKEIVPQILQRLDDKQAVVLVGSRQVGKTSILYLLIQHLLEKGKNLNNIFYPDIENFDQLNLVEDRPELPIRSLRLEGADFRERGSLTENYIFSHLYRNLSVLQNLNFRRTKNGMEVDFVLQLEPNDKGERQILPVEVKYQTMKRPVFPSGLKNFLTVYPANKAVVVTKDFYTIQRNSHTTVLFIPAYFMGISTLDSSG